MKIILASSSPRRKELLKEIFPSFLTLSPDCDEANSATPQKTVLNLSKLKADWVSDEYDILISADTIVVYKNQILGKPSSPEDAIKILSLLSGKYHKVYTGVCIKYNRNGIIKSMNFYDCSKVKMRKLSQKDIEDYVNTGSPLDKAGAYGIQDGVVERYYGSYSNIVGLPLEKIKRKLKRVDLI